MRNKKNNIIKKEDINKNINNIDFDCIKDKPDFVKFNKKSDKKGKNTPIDFEHDFDKALELAKEEQEIIESKIDDALKRKQKTLFMKLLVCVLGIIAIFIYFLMISVNSKERKIYGDKTENDNTVYYNGPATIEEQITISSKETSENIDASNKIVNFSYEEDISRKSIEEQINYLLQQNDTVLNNSIKTPMEYEEDDNYAPVYKVKDPVYQDYTGYKAVINSVYSLNADIDFVDNNVNSPMYFETDGVFYYNSSYDTSWCNPISFDKISSTRYEVVDQDTAKIEIFVTYENDTGKTVEKSVTATLTDNGYRLDDLLLS